MRRERNKLAAAKCRNRRKELTDFLQAVSTGRCGGCPGPGPPNLRGARLPWACEAPEGGRIRSPLPPGSRRRSSPSEKTTRKKRLKISYSASHSQQSRGELKLRRTTSF